MAEPGKSEQETGVCSQHHIRMQRPECGRCHGEGAIEDDDDFMSFRPNIVTCWRCHGSGEAPWFECELCVQDAQDQEDEYWRKQEAGEDRKDG